MSTATRCVAYQIHRLTLLIVAFYHARSFNSDVSRWDVSSVKYFDGAFQGAERFNFKATVEHAWQSNENYPGSDMFTETCSEDRENGGSCGVCGDVSAEANQQPADCGSSRQSRAENLQCTFCSDFGDECCEPLTLGDENMNDAVSVWLQDKLSATRTYGSISLWDTSEVTDMSYLFCSASESDCNGQFKILGKSFNGDLSKWDVRKVTDMSHIFEGAVHFNSDISKWDVAHVTSMNGSKLSGFNQFTFVFHDVDHFMCWHLSVCKCSKLQKTSRFFFYQNYRKPYKKFGKK